MTVTPREKVLSAMRIERPEGIPVMCQMALGHILLNSKVDPVEFFLSSDAYAQGLLFMREMYDFDGVLLHKPGRENGWEPFIASIDRSGECPVIRLKDGASIECRWDDDPYFLFPAGFRLPLPGEVDPEDPLSALPETYRHWCLMKATAPFGRVEDFPEYWYRALDRVLEDSNGRYSVHGEVRAAMDSVIACFGIEETMVALLTEPEKIEPVLRYFAERSAAWAEAQVRRGADAVKISAPFAGGGFISREHYRRFILPYERAIGERVRAAGGFAYIHTCGAIGDRLDLMEATGVHGLECLDPPPLGNVDLKEAVKLLEGKLFIKGNVDSVNTLLQKDVEGVRRDVQEVLRAGAGMSGFILSTACSIAPPVKPENIHAMVEEGHRWQ